MRRISGSDTSGSNQWNAWPTVIAAADPEIRKVLATMDAAYGDSDYLVESTLSLPDILLAPIVRTLSMTPGGDELLAPFAHVRRAHVTISERPGFQQAIDAPPISQAA